MGLFRLPATPSTCCEWLGRNIVPARPTGSRLEPKRVKSGPGAL